MDGVYQIIENRTKALMFVYELIRNLPNSIRQLTFLIKSLEKPYIIIYGPFLLDYVNDECGPLVYVYKSQITSGLYDGGFRLYYANTHGNFLYILLG